MLQMSKIFRDCFQKMGIVDFNQAYYHWDVRLWQERKELFADKWDSLSVDRRRMLIRDLIIHSYDVVSAERSCRIERQKV